MSERIQLVKMFVDDDIRKAAMDVLDGGYYINGPEVKAFGQEFADFCGAGHGVATSSGTTALFALYSALGLKPGDEIIAPSHTFAATVTPAMHLGVKPVFADIDPDTYTITADTVKPLITERTKAIVPVHLYGHTADMAPLMELANENGLTLIEDACQSHGATYKGRKAGSLGHAACFSFFPSKNMTVAGDGGMVVTSDEELAGKVSKLINQGRSSKYVHDILGFNFRLSELPSAVGRAQLRKLPGWVEARRKWASVYSELLADLPDVITPRTMEWAEHAYYVYTIQVPDRDGLAEYLNKNDVATGIYYPVPLHKQPCIEQHIDMTSLPHTDACVDRIISLPMHPMLTKEMVERVCASIRNFFGG